MISLQLDFRVLASISSNLPLPPWALIEIKDQFPSPYKWMHWGLENKKTTYSSVRDIVDEMFLAKESWIRWPLIPFQHNGSIIPRLVHLFKRQSLDQNQGSLPVQKPLEDKLQFIFAKESNINLDFSVQILNICWAACKHYLHNFHGERKRWVKGWRRNRARYAELPLCNWYFP